jgi:hypothetical protein
MFAEPGNGSFTPGATTMKKRANNPRLITQISCVNEPETALPQFHHVEISYFDFFGGFFAFAGFSATGFIGFGFGSLDFGAGGSSSIGASSSKS